MANHSNNSMLPWFIGIGAYIAIIWAYSFKADAAGYKENDPWQFADPYQRAIKLQMLHTGAMEWERVQAMGKNLGDGTKVVTSEGRKIYMVYRPVKAGEIAGSDFIVSGGINSLDFNKMSKGFEFTIDGVGLGHRGYEMQVGMDLTVTNTRTGEIIWVQGFKRTLYGAETKAGAFRIFDVDGDRLVDINLGKETHGPVQMGLRWMADFAAATILNTINKSDCLWGYYEKDSFIRLRTGSGAICCR